MRFSRHLSSLFRLAQSVQERFRELGVDGVAFVVFFCCLVPFVRIYFYVRDIARGIHPMTGFPTPRLRLAFPFLYRPSQFR